MIASEYQAGIAATWVRWPGCALLWQWGTVSYWKNQELQDNTRETVGSGWQLRDLFVYLLCTRQLGRAEGTGRAARWTECLRALIAGIHCVCKHTWTRSWSGAAASRVQMPRCQQLGGGGWDLGADAGQTGCLSIAAGGDPHYVYIHICIPWNRPSWPTREGNGMKSLVLFVCLWVLHVLICVASHVHLLCACWLVCLPAQPCCQLDLGPWSYGNPTSVGLLDLATP